MYRIHPNYIWYTIKVIRIIDLKVIHIIDYVQIYFSAGLAKDGGEKRGSGLDNKDLPI